jgi:uncharacterized membrane protein HdeD (DUF308 family)
MLATSLQIVGVLLLLLEIRAVVCNIQMRKEKSEDWQKAYRKSRIVGVVLGFSSIFMTYPTRGTHDQLYKIIGIPFMAGAFDEKGADYVSVLTPLIMGINIIWWVLLPELYVWLKGKFEKRCHRTHGV